jgi:hypothetical protein
VPHKLICGNKRIGIIPIIGQLSFHKENGGKYEVAIKDSN